MYLSNLALLKGTPVFQLSVQNRDLGYNLLSHISLYFGFGIWGVNLFSALIFSTGLILFCRSLKRSWLALAVSVPYLITVVGMGYTRQSVALGFLLIAFYTLSKGARFQTIFSILFAIAFQKTAVLTLVFILPALINVRLTYKSAIQYLLSLILIGFAYAIFLSGQINILIAGYLIDHTMNSDGALVRVLLNFIPAFLFLLYGSRLNLSRSLYLLWLGMSLYSVFLLIALPISPSSTVVDRLALYALPLQPFVFSSLPDLNLFKLKSKYMSLSVIILFFAIQYVWFFYSNTSFAWVPYRIYDVFAYN